MENKIPSYRKHSSGQAYIRFGNKQTYLGKYGSEASIARYEKAIAEWLAGVNNDDVHSVVELCAAYFKHAENYYRKAGQPTSEMDSVRAAIKKLRGMYGDLDVIEFRPRYLMAYQQAWVQHGLTRNGCNRMVKVVRRIFKWGVSREIVPPDVLGSLNAVAMLKKGRTEAPETKRVKPVDLETIQQTMQVMGPTVADMVVLQLLSGCRPGELCRLASRKQKARHVSRLC